MFLVGAADGSTHSGGTDCEEGQLRRRAALGGGQYHVTLVSGSLIGVLLAPVNQTLRNLFSGATCTVPSPCQLLGTALEFVRNNSSSLALIDVGNYTGPPRKKSLGTS